MNIDYSTIKQTLNAVCSIPDCLKKNLSNHTHFPNNLTEYMKIPTVMPASLVGVATVVLLSGGTIGSIILAALVGTLMLPKLVELMIKVIGKGHSATQYSSEIKVAIGIGSLIIAMYAFCKIHKISITELLSPQLKKAEGLQKVQQFRKQGMFPYSRNLRPGAEAPSDLSTDATADLPAWQKRGLPTPYTTKINHFRHQELSKYLPGICLPRRTTQNPSNGIKPFFGQLHLFPKMGRQPVKNRAFTKTQPTKMASPFLSPLSMPKARMIPTGQGLCKLR